MECERNAVSVESTRFWPVYFIYAHLSKCISGINLELFRHSLSLYVIQGVLFITMR